MKFKFSLQKVLEHRKVVEDLAQKSFQEAVTRFNEQVALLDQMINSKSAAHQSAGTLTSQGGAQGPALSQIHEFLKGQEIRIQRQRQYVEEAEKLVEEKREVLRQAALEYKIMEKMREKKFEDYKQDRLAREQKEMDEQNILRFKAVEES